MVCTKPSMLQTNCSWCSYLGATWTPWTLCMMVIFEGSVSSSKNDGCDMCGYNEGLRVLSLKAKLIDDYADLDRNSEYFILLRVSLLKLFCGTPSKKASGSVST